MATALINGSNKRLEDWSQINWRKVKKTVRNLRTRIFRARQRGFLEETKKSSKVNDEKLRQPIA